MTNDTTKMHNTMKMHFYKIFLKFCEKTVKIIVSYLINLENETSCLAKFQKLKIWDGSFC